MFNGSYFKIYPETGPNGKPSLTATYYLEVCCEVPEVSEDEFKSLCRSLIHTLLRSLYGDSLEHMFRVLCETEDFIREHLPPFYQRDAILDKLHHQKVSIVQNFRYAYEGDPYTRHFHHEAYDEFLAPHMEELERGIQSLRCGDDPDGEQQDMPSVQVDRSDVGPGRSG